MHKHKRGNHMLSVSRKEERGKSAPSMQTFNHAEKI